MTLLQAVGTLLFLGVVAAVVGLLAYALAQLARRRPGRALRVLGGLAVLVLLYLLPVAAVSVATPRHERTGGAPVCFDDWCVAVRAARPAPAPGAHCPTDGSVWLLSLEVSSRARRVTQREKAAAVYAEDRSGRRYPMCGRPLAQGGRVPALRDAVAPGDSFALTLPFALPVGVAPVGVVVRHPHTPAAVILGDDEALFHQPTLLRLPTR